MFTTTPRGFKSGAERVDDDHSSSPKEPLTMGQELSAFLYLMQRLNVQGCLFFFGEFNLALFLAKIYKCHLLLFSFAKYFPLGVEALDFRSPV